MQEQEKTASVYGLKDPRNGEIFYIGVSVDPYTRYGQHLAMLDKCNPTKDAYILDILRDGLIPGLLIVESNIPARQAFERETYWIHYYASTGSELVNKTVVAKRTSAKPHSTSKCDFIQIDTVEDAKVAGLDVSCYQLFDGQWWLSSSDACALISFINEHEINNKYLINPIRQGRLHPRKVSNRCNLYLFDELIKIDLKPAGRPRLPEDQLTDTARRQRAFKERRRQLAQESLV